MNKEHPETELIRVETLVYIAQISKIGIFKQLNQKTH